jgi:hypothetical protein
MIYLPYTPNTTHRPIYSKLGDTGGFGPSPKFGFENPLHFFNLPPPSSVLPNHPVRHMFGLSHPSPTPRKNLLRFFSLLANLSTHHPTHNREVYLSNRGAPNIHNIIIGLWQTHPPTLGRGS